MIQAASQTPEPAKVRLATKPLGIIGSAMTARRNVLELIPEIALRQPMVSGRLGIRWHMVMDPEALARILKDRVDDYPKSAVTRMILEPAIGQSLFVAEGAHWRWQRRAAAPAFASRNVQALGPVMTAAARASAGRIARAQGQPVDLFQETVAATFEVISDVTFSGDEGFDRDAVHGAIDGYIAQTAKVSVLDVLGLPAWVPRPGRLLSGPGLRRMKRVADQAIAQRAARGPRPVPDLLDLLRAGQDPETGRQMSRDELRDNLLTFIVAGHETTALTLAWALYLCAFDPGVQDRAAVEARTALAGRDAAGAEDLPALPFITRIVDETLRLYPPAAFLSRTAMIHDTLGGREVRPGDTVMLPIYALHRHRLWWTRPDAFDPDRFRVTPHRFTFLPFGAGPRICIGANFAVQEAVVILATLLARFRFALSPRHPPPQPRMILTLRPSGGVWLQATPRG